MLGFIIFSLWISFGIFLYVHYKNKFKGGGGANA